MARDWHAGRRSPFSHSEAAMLVGSAVRRVAIVGGMRIPFARSMGAYAEASNQEMLTATLAALVDRYRLKGADARRRRRGRGAQAFARLQSDARMRARQRSGAGNARVRSAARLRHEPRYRDRHRPEDRDGTDRFGHRRRRRHRERRADRLSGLVSAHPAAQRARQIARRAPVAVVRIAAAPFQAAAARRWSSRTPACRWARAAS